MILLIFLVKTSPGKCSSTDARRPVPRFVGQEVRYPIFSSKAMSSCASTASSIREAMSWSASGIAVDERLFADLCIFCQQTVHMAYLSSETPLKARAATMVFSNEMDAWKVEEVLPKRLGRFGLAVHPEKTRLIRFLPPGGGSGGSGHSRPSFDLLGFTHFWGKSLKGNWVVKRKTAKDRLARALKAVGEWCRVNRHNDVADQFRTLVLKVKGHYQYYGITGNSRRINAFRDGAQKLWWKWLNRRSQRSNMTWQNFDLLKKAYRLPFAVVVHSIYRRAARP